jgi:hypothetical protein
VRRLSHEEYDNTVRDLLGDTRRPAAEFLAEVAQDGFTNNAGGQTVAPALAEQYMSAAEALSETASLDLPALLGCDPTGADEINCVAAFIDSFGKRAWRRPLETDEQQRLFDLYALGRNAYGVQEGISYVLQALLQSPHFLYLLELGDALGDAPADAPADATAVPLDSWQMATRLSYFLLGSMPDVALFQAAELGELSDAGAVRAQTERLLSLPEARVRMGQFFSEWMGLRKIEFMTKDAELYPNFSTTLPGQMRWQLELFATSIVLEHNGTHRELLTAPFSYVTERFAAAR